MSPVSVRLFPRFDDRSQDRGLKHVFGALQKPQGEQALRQPTVEAQDEK